MSFTSGKRRVPSERGQVSAGGCPRRRRRRVRTVAVVASAVVGVLLLGTAWVGTRVSDARDHLDRAAVLAETLMAQAGAADLAGARGTLAALQRETRAARASTADAGWRLGYGVPLAGDDFTAVRAVAVAVDDLAHQALPGLLAAAARVSVGGVTPRNGRIDLGELRAVTPGLVSADRAVRRARGQLATIVADGLVPPVRVAVDDLLRRLDRAVEVISTAARAAALLPAMLGADAPRTYLVLFQNLAEVRATGGMPGAYVAIQASAGTVRIVDQGTASTNLQIFDDPVLAVGPAMRDLYTDRLTTFPADVNFTPHFPTAAALIREMYRRRSGRQVDGVFATDPVALAYLLGAIGPVSTSGGGRLTAANAVHSLLSETYRRLPAAGAQDRYFGRAARAVFDRLTRAPGDPRALLAALLRAARERRILLWSARPTEQSLIGGTVLEGAMPTSDADRSRVGVFLNDGTGAKLGYYLDRAVKVTAGACLPDGRSAYRVRVTLRSTAPRRGLPRSVLGLSLAGPYTIRTNVLVFSPAGGAVGHASLDGRAAGLATGAERERAVAVVTVDVPPGVSRTLDVTVLTAAGANAIGAPELWLTPGPRPWSRDVDSPAPCRPAR